METDCMSEKYMLWTKDPFSSIIYIYIYIYFFSFSFSFIFSICMSVSMSCFYSPKWRHHPRAAKNGTNPYFSRLKSYNGRAAVQSQTRDGSRDVYRPIRAQYSAQSWDRSCQYCKPVTLDYLIILIIKNVHISAVWRATGLKLGGPEGP